MIDPKAFNPKWIRFEEIKDFSGQRKTKTFEVINKETKRSIGTVKWYGPFRQYAYFPDIGTAYERQCMIDITRFIHYLVLERRENKNLIQKA